jgi:hypothetical protein
MTGKKRFDSVEMKNAVQAKLLAELERLGGEEFERRRREWRERSDDPLARWWREPTARRAGRTPEAHASE